MLDPSEIETPAGDQDDGGGAERAEPGRIRPGGRTARVRRAVLHACGDALVEHGFDYVDLADVARRAGVGKTTVYRRWGSVCALVTDLVSEMAEQSLARTETGSLSGDLRANARLVQRTLADARQGALFRAVIAAAVSDAGAAEALRRFYAVRIDEWEPCVRQAIDRGELPADTDTREVVRAVSAPLYYRMLTTREPLDEAAADRAADAAVAAARAGVYARAGERSRSDDRSEGEGRDREGDRPRDGEAAGAAPDD